MNNDLNIKFSDDEFVGQATLRQAQLIMLGILKTLDNICRENKLTYWLDSGTLLGAVRHKGFIPWDDDIDIVMPRKDYKKFIDIAKEQLPEDLFLQTTVTDEGYDMPWMKIRDCNSYIKEYKVGNYHHGIFIDIFPADIYGEDYYKAESYKNRYKIIYRVITTIKEPFETIGSMKILVKNIIKLVLKVVLFPITLMSKETIFRELDIVREKLSSKIVDDNGDYIGYGIEAIFWNILLMEKREVFPLKQLKFESGSFYVPNNYNLYLNKLFGNYMELPPEKDRIPHNLEIKTVLTEKEKEVLIVGGN